MRLKIISLLIGTIFVTACATTTATPPSSYPPPQNTAASETIYPITTSTPDPSIIPFRLHRPVQEGATIITGTGPAGVPIVLQDVTFMGVDLGQTVIGPDNTFVLEIAPLEKGHRIGVKLGDLSNTQWTEDDFYSPDYYGEEPVQLPQVAFYYDSVMVQAAP